MKAISTEVAQSVVGGTHGSPYDVLGMHSTGEGVVIRTFQPYAREVEIVDGLAAGEPVITDGTLKVRAGSKVTIRAMDDGTTPIHELLESGQADTPAP